MSQSNPYGQYPNGHNPYGHNPYGQWTPPAPKPGLIPLRPLSFGEILDGSFTSVRKNPKATLGLSAIVMTGYGVFGAIAALALSSTLHSIHLQTSGQLDSSSQSRHEEWHAFAVLLPYAAVTLIVSFIATELLNGLLTTVVGSGVLGRQLSIGQAWRLSRPRLGAVFASVLLRWLITLGLLSGGLGAAVLIGAIVGTVSPPLGAIIGVLIGLVAVLLTVFLWIRFSLATPVVMLEAARPVLSLRRSWRLVDTSWWRVFGILLLSIIVVEIAANVLEVPFGIVSRLISPGSAGSGLVGLVHTGQTVAPSALAVIVIQVGAVVAAAVSRPVLAGATALLYTDLRMRREGLDIALQAAASERPAGDQQPSDEPPADQPPRW